MKTDKQIFYHISRENNWNIGNVITAGEVENPFWSISKNCTPIVPFNGENIPIYEIINRKHELGISEQHIELLYKALENVSKEFVIYVREQIFEEFRKNNYPKLPSRQKCLWVSEADTLSYWKTMEKDMPRSLLTLELEGELFCADERWLTTDSFSSIVYWEKAKHYWAGEMSASPIKEYLFYGKAIVKDIQSFI